jgi:hypothetical protein
MHPRAHSRPLLTTVAVVTLLAFPAPSFAGTNPPPWDVVVTPNQSLARRLDVGCPRRQYLETLDAFHFAGKGFCSRPPVGSHNYAQPCRLGSTRACE